MISPRNFTLFEKLPLEIQLMIWTAALQDAWVGVCPGKTQFRYTPALAISAVCRTARLHVKKTHHYRLVRCGRFHRLNKRWDIVPTNPDTDTFILPISHGSCVPFPRNVHPDHASTFFCGRTERIQHIRKLILFETTMFPSDAVFGSRVPTTRLVQELKNLPQTALAPSQPEDKDLLLTINLNWIERFQNLNDLTYVTRKTHYSWWIGGEYRVHGPDVVSRPAENCLWHGKPKGEADWLEDYLEGNPIDQGLEYYEKMGISDDTGTTWAFDANNTFTDNIWQFALQHRLGIDRCRKGVGYNGIRQRSVMRQYSRNTLAVVPKIGLRGYSYNTSSCGGFWAGYRLYLGDHPRLEFSPLVWDDVKEYVHSFQTYEDNREDASESVVYQAAEDESIPYEVTNIEPSSPEMIVKLYIIRNGEQAPPSHPHHCWEPVSGDFSNCGDLQGVDWRPIVPVDPPPTTKDFRKFMAPGFNRRLSDKDKMLLCDREEKLLRNLNRVRIREIFGVLLRALVSNYTDDFPVPYHFHEGNSPRGSTV